MKVEIWRKKGLNKELIKIANLEDINLDEKDFDKGEYKDENFIYKLKTEKEATLDFLLSTKISDLKSSFEDKKIRKSNKSFLSKKDKDTYFKMYGYSLEPKINKKPILTDIRFPNLKRKSSIADVEDNNIKFLSEMKIGDRKTKEGKEFEKISDWTWKVDDIPYGLNGAYNLLTRPSSQIPLFPKEDDRIEREIGYKKFSGILQKDEDFKLILYDIEASPSTKIDLFYDRKHDLVKEVLYFYNDENMEPRINIFPLEEFNPDNYGEYGHEFLEKIESIDKESQLIYADIAKEIISWFKNKITFAKDEFGYFTKEYKEYVKKLYRDFRKKLEEAFSTLKNWSKEKVEEAIRRYLHWAQSISGVPAFGVIAQKKESRLIKKYNKNTSKEEWAFVSKSNPDKVLKWFGKTKPSQEEVNKQERRVQYFKHQGKYSEMNFKIKDEFEDLLELNGALGAYGTIVNPQKVFEAAEKFTTEELKMLSDWYNNRLMYHNNPAIATVVALLKIIISKRENSLTAGLKIEAGFKEWFPKFQETLMKLLKNNNIEKAKEWVKRNWENIKGYGSEWTTTFKNYLKMLKPPDVSQKLISVTANLKRKVRLSNEEQKIYDDLVRASYYIYKNGYWDANRFEEEFGFNPTKYPEYFRILPKRGKVVVLPKFEDFINMRDNQIKRRHTTVEQWGNNSKLKRKADRVSLQDAKYYVYVRPGYIEYFNDIEEAKEFADEYNTDVKGMETDEIVYDSTELNKYVDKKWVWGTRDNKWHLVGPEDRDYSQGITQEEFKRLGPKRSKQKYLSPHVITGNAYNEKKWNWGWVTYHSLGWIDEDGRKAYEVILKAENDMYNWTKETIKIWTKHIRRTLAEILNNPMTEEEVSELNEKKFDDGNKVIGFSSGLDKYKKVSEGDKKSDVKDIETDETVYEFSSENKHHQGSYIDIDSLIGEEIEILEDKSIKIKEKKMKKNAQDKNLKEWQDYWGLSSSIVDVLEFDFSEKYPEESEKYPEEFVTDGEGWGLFETSDGRIYQVIVYDVPYDLSLKDALEFAWKSFGICDAMLTDWHWEKY